MRKVTLLAAAAFAAAFFTTSNIAASTTARAQAAADPNQNTHNFIRDAMNPYMATAKPASPKAARKKAKKK